MRLAHVDTTSRKIPLKEKLGKFDAIGIVLLIASITCLFLALQMGGTSVAWNSSKPIGFLIGFGLLAIAFGIRQWQAGENATIPVRFFKDRTVIFGSLYLFWDNMANYIVSRVWMYDA